MSKVSEIYDGLSHTERTVLDIIGHSNHIRPTRLQKISLVVGVKELSNIPQTHGAYFFGAFSDEVDESAEGLREEGIIAYKENEGYRLTKLGNEVYDIIKISDKQMNEKVERVIRLFSSMRDEEVTAITYALYPQYASQSLIRTTMEKVASKLDISKIREEMERI